MTTETSANKPTMTVFSARVALTARPLVATVGNNPSLTLGFGLGCSVLNSVIGGLTL
jgi:hypothetical protein